LSFLAHASAEKKQSAIGFWMNQVGLSVADIQHSKVGIR
jgi:hypothetical protein